MSIYLLTLALAFLFSTANISANVSCNYDNSLQELKSLMVATQHTIFSIQNLVRQQSLKITLLEDRIVLLESSLKKIGCPNGYVKYGNSCYKLYTSRLQRQRAMSTCNEEGGSLVAIESSEEQQFIVGLMKTKNGGGHVLTSGTEQGTGGIWIWEATSAPITSPWYTNWQPGEPNNCYGSPCKSEDCIELYSDGKWNDIPCIQTFAFICEIRV